MNKLYSCALLLLLLAALAACTPSRPKGVLSPEEMEDVLVDYHLAQGMAENSDSRQDELRLRYVQAVFRKYGITEAVFDSSLVYYGGCSEKLDEIYTRVMERLQTQAQRNGVNENQEQNMYANLTAEGDTANIWQGANFLTILPDKLHNIFQFSISADSTFRPGDQFIWHFRTQFVSQGMMRDTYALLYLEYEDTTVCTSMSIGGNMVQDLRYDPSNNLDSLALKNVKGLLFQAPKEKGNTNFQLLLLQDISLIRMHKPEEKPAFTDVAEETDSLDVDSINADTVPVQTESHERLTPTQMRESQPREHRINVVKEQPIRINRNRNGGTRKRRML